MKKSGTVVSVSGQSVKIQICQESACGGCAAKTLCNLSNSKEKVIECGCTNAGDYSVGDKVTVEISRNQGFLVTLFAYIFPLIIIVGVLFGAMAAGAGEGESAIAALLSVAAYFGILYFHKNKLNKTIKFELKKQ